MKLASTLLLGPLLHCAGCKALHSESTDIALLLEGGEAQFGSSGWPEFGSASVLGAALEIEPHSWPCGIEIGAQSSGASGREAGDSLDGDVSEYWIGACKTWRPNSWLLVQAGAGLRYAECEVLWPTGLPFVNDSDSDSSLGAYAHVGALFRTGESFSIGIDARWADGADYELRNLNRDALLTQWLLCLRWQL